MRYAKIMTREVRRMTMESAAYRAHARALGAAFWGMAEKYGFKRKDEALFLGIRFNGERLGKLQKDREIPDEPDVLQRVGNLLGIHKNLRILYPYNRELVYGFFGHEWELLGGRTPLAFLHEAPLESFARLFTLRRLLDQIRNGR